MIKIKCLNVGCGGKYHSDWINIDMKPLSPEVIDVDLYQGIPFPDNTFDVVYHSQVLEHFPKERALGFISECYRVLKPNGIIRVVVPDLENIVDEYKRILNECVDKPSSVNEANYDWIMLELFDQIVRNVSGGQMAEFLMQPQMINENYVIDRIGFVAKDIRRSVLNQNQNIKVKKTYKGTSIYKFVRRLLRPILRLLIKDKNISKISKVSDFRNGGEIHQWMYDRFSITRLLKNAGFNQVTIKNPYSSAILNWDSYELDVKGDIVYDPNSLFIEAVKV